MTPLTTKAAEIRAGLVAEQTVAEWRAAMGGVTPGPWYSESVETEGSYGSGEDTTEGFDSYVVRTEAQKSYGEDAVVCDALNAGTAEVHEEFDEDGTRAWDEPGRCTMAWIARCSPAGIAPLLALIEQQAAGLAAVGKVKHYLRMAEVEDPWSAMIDECEAMEARATTAESERDEWRKDHADLYALHMRRSAERDEARAALQVAKDGWRDAEATIASQSERIAVLEAALRPFAARIDEIEQVKAIAKFAPEGTAAVKLTLLRDARSALAPLGEE